MQRNRRPEREDEPEVTFELEETPRAQRGGTAGAAGAAAVAGAGLISSASAAELDDSLDVFDQTDETPAGPDAVPTTSFQDLAEPDPDFPPIDFAAGAGVSVDADATVDASDAFGATAHVGGGFVLDETSGAEAFGAPDNDLEPLSETLSEADYLDDVQELDDDAPDDIDLS